MKKTLKVQENQLKIEADPFRMKLIAEAISEYVEKHMLEDDATQSLRVLEPLV